MAMDNEKVRICDVIDYEKDILPFPLIKIYSGIGSGRSYFATKMITGSKEYININNNDYHYTIIVIMGLYTIKL